MKLIFVRHGETQDNIENIASGRRNVPLTKKGILQAYALADRFKDEKIDIIYSSPLKRCLSVARIINQFHHAPIQIENNFSEYDWGEWEGMDLNEVFKQRAEKDKKGKRSKRYLRAPSGESFHSMELRVKKSVRQIIRNYPGQTILIVSHGGVNKLILNCLFNLGLDDFVYINQDYGCVNVIQEKYGFLQIHLVNDTSHLLKRNLI